MREGEFPEEIGQHFFGPRCGSDTAFNVDPCVFGFLPL
jgi:hypothetical protein